MQDRAGLVDSTHAGRGVPQLRAWRPSTTPSGTITPRTNQPKTNQNGAKQRQRVLMSAACRQAGYCTS